MSFLKEYTLLGELGTGGFAKVYKVRHNTLGYIRAIRVLNEPVTDEKSRTYQKFLRECKVLLRLGNGNHRNIVHIYQPRLLENHALVEMDYVDGKDISHYLNENGNFLPIDEVLRMVEEISSALAYCHEDIYKFCMDPDEDQLECDPIDGSKWIVDDVTRKRLIEKYKVIHNDIHSGNIMRREDGSFVLLDFGLAITGEDDVRNSSRHENGAIEFKAPEKWDNEAILTEQSDIYSFGVVIYEYLAGRVPFSFDKRVSNRTEAEFKLNKAHKEQTPPSVYELRKAAFEAKYPGKAYEKDFPDWLEGIIMKCLEKEPSKRFKNGKALHDLLTRHIKEETEQSKADSHSKIESLQKELGKAKDEADYRKRKYKSATTNCGGTSNGYPELIWEEGRYVGETVNGMPHGKGTLYYKTDDSADRISYEGDWVNGCKEGNGIMIWKSGSKYEGQWKNDVRFGQGTHYWADGDRYEGAWENDKRNGYGVFYFLSGEWNGDRYEGNFKDGSFQGQGTYYWANGNRYEGAWENDKRDGYGIEYFSGKWAGDRREGNWKNGERNGKATYYWQDGDIDYENYVDGKEEGEFIRVKKDGTKMKAKYKNGEMIKDWHRGLFS